MKLKFLLLFIAILILNFPNEISAEPIEINCEIKSIDLAKNLQYFEDKESKETINTIQNKKFTKVNSNPNFGYTNSTFWVKFNFISNCNLNLLLELEYPLLDYINFFSIQNYKIIENYTIGDMVNFSKRKIINRHPLFPLKLKENQELEIYLCIKTSGSVIFPLTIWSEQEFYFKDHYEQIILGLYYGIILIMAIYNFLLFLSLKDKVHFIYVIYIVSILLIHSNLNGIAFELFLGNYPSLFNFLLPILLLTGTIASLFYSFYFLDTKINFPKFHKILIIMISYSSILFILSFILDYSNIIKITAANGIISFVFQLILGIYALLHGIRSAKFFVVGWSFVCLGFIIFALKNFGVMPVNLFTEYSSQIGTALEVVFLSLALADRINKMKEEKVNLQKQALENQKELTKSFARFVPPQLLTFLGKDIITNVGLGDAIKKEMTILFSDIRSFTSISESMTPDENFGFINSYMATMGPCIRKHNGFIDKYIGDAIMALFPENPSDAIDASIDMLEELHNLNQRRKKKGFIPISIGIGIHTGSQMLGIIGEKERLEGTVISDVVNTASRLEGLTKAYSSSLIVSGDVLQNLDSSKYQYRLLDNIKVKGKDRAVRIYEILNGNSKRIIELKLKTKPDFEKAIELYTKGKFKEALKIFKSILKTDSKDKAFLLYIDRCNFYSKNGVSPEWDGIEKLDFK